MLRQPVYSLLILFSLSSIFLSAQPVRVIGLSCEYRINPLGIDVTKPRLSWQLASTQRNTIQSAYELRVGTDLTALSKGQKMLWQTGKIMSDQSTQVVYEGPALQPKQHCYWQVRVWDGAQKSSNWSEVSSWEMGLLTPTDWTAKWIYNAQPQDTTVRPSPLFRKAFTLKKAIRSARAYVTAHGLYEAQINGKSVGDLCLTPGWTSYGKRLQYQVYDITSLLQQVPMPSE